MISLNKVIFERMRNGQMVSNSEDRNSRYTFMLKSLLAK